MTSMTGNMGNMPKGAYSTQQRGQMMAGPTGKTGSRVKGYNIGQIQNFTPEMMQVYQDMIGNVGPDSFLGRLAGGDQSQFEEMEAPALKQFSQLQGNLASRFSGMGQGARKSSGFQNASNMAAQDFAQQLQSQRLGLRQQALKELMGMSSDILNKQPYQTTYTEKGDKSSGWGGAIGAGIGGLGGFLAGGPVGAFKGATLGHTVGSGF